jgi:hypothetical protein
MNYLRVSSAITLYLASAGLMLAALIVALGGLKQEVALSDAFFATVILVLLALSGVIVGLIIETQNVSRYSSMFIISVGAFFLAATLWVQVSPTMLN